ncbi:MAG: hypothetical protein IKT45_00955 [Lachnospiraceae bacterium]|nr:hypothetical protein [Lachnospiraceae bacterium]
MVRKIYTKKESLQKVSQLIVLTIAAVLYHVLGFQGMVDGVFYLMYLVLGGLGIWQLVEALRWRKKHRICLETQTPQKGWIVDCIGETIYHRTIRSGYTEYRYYLLVDIYVKGLSTPITIQSDAYPRPVYQDLSSPEVDVYESDTEAGYTLDGFQYKYSADEPDILPESLRKQLPIKELDSWVFLVAFILLLLTVANKYS